MQHIETESSRVPQRQQKKRSGTRENTQWVSMNIKSTELTYCKGFLVAKGSSFNYNDDCTNNMKQNEQK